MAGNSPALNTHTFRPSLPAASLSRFRIHSPCFPLLMATTNTCSGLTSPRLDRIRASAPPKLFESKSSRWTRCLVSSQIQPCVLRSATPWSPFPWVNTERLPAFPPSGARPTISGTASFQLIAERPSCSTAQATAFHRACRLIPSSAPSC